MSSKVFTPKIALIGDSGVGKTSMMRRYCRGTFQHHTTSIGLDHATKKLEIDGISVELQVWDTAGQERFRTITQSYYRNAHGVVVVYDITDNDSLTGLTKWFDDVKRYAPDEVLMCLVGAKKDMETRREVQEEQARKLASDYPNVIDVIETSAKDNINIDKVFETLMRNLKSRSERKHSTSSTKPEQLGWNTEKKKRLKDMCSSSCC